MTAATRRIAPVRTLHVIAILFEGAAIGLILVGRIIPAALLIAASVALIVWTLEILRLRSAREPRS
ncbi:hypothetical protein [Sphingomonas oligophenolica]|uniref:Uncharacterized protein n=1 Tax=Sphingomonas oligophenolica TaxID=301154 RepID=A0A502CMG4_9SPHN|nr:hypothetical protein [Sphingomonas oligophenolica]TPG14387.1 hypothetical protein EAH84_03505 [Sphingomonas oligophenolica]